MKIQLDYNNKIVTIENNVSLGDFYGKIITIIPDWQEWVLQTSTVINNWPSNPIIIDRYPTYPITPYPDTTKPWWLNPITCKDDGVKPVYSLEVNY